MFFRSPQADAVYDFKVVWLAALRVLKCWELQRGLDIRLE